MAAKLVTAIVQRETPLPEGWGSNKLWRVLRGSETNMTCIQCDDEHTCRKVFRNSGIGAGQSIVLLDGDGIEIERRNSFRSPVFQYIVGAIQEGNPVALRELDDWFVSIHQGEEDHFVNLFLRNSHCEIE